MKMFRAAILIFLGISAWAMENRFQNEQRISVAVREILLKTNAANIQILYDSTNSKLAIAVLKMLQSKSLLVEVYQLSTPPQMKKHCDRMKLLLPSYSEVTSIVLVSSAVAEMYSKKVNEAELGGRNLLHIFVWQDWPLRSGKVKILAEASRVAVYSWYTSSKIFKLFSSHANPKNPSKLYKINIWQEDGGFSIFPVLLDLKQVYRNLRGRVLKVPVMHKPPWYFIKKEENASLEVIGGRDHQLLKEISLRMNFRYEYFEPTEETEGRFEKLGKGALGLLRKRKVDLFLGDAAITYERTQDLDFSFFTVADSVAFITHSPRPLSEAWALVRPFHWQVWLAVSISIAVIAPALHLISKKTLATCTWTTVAILLKQSTKEMGKSNKTRFITILLWVTATYVIGDLYCANLTSILAKPGKESNLKSLSELEKGVQDRRYTCLVEERSSGAEFLKNGTREAQRLWALMQQQPRWTVSSVERGVAIVRGQRGVVLLASRQTLLFELQRFGPRNFFLSGPLNTQYSAIALQQGCPFLDNINEVVMRLFEAGILDWMTSLEYARLGNQIREVKGNPEQTEETAAKGKPLSMRMLQGAFLLLAVGYFLAGLVLGLEHFHFRHPQKFAVRLHWKKWWRTLATHLHNLISRIVD